MKKKVIDDNDREVPDIITACPSVCCPYKKEFNMLHASDVEMDLSVHPMSPCRCLAVAVIERALRDLSSERYSDKKSAEQWLFNELSKAEYSVYWYAEVAGKTVAAIRKKATEIINNPDKTFFGHQRVTRHGQK